MDFSELEQHLADRGLQSLYMIRGPEDFLKGAALKLIRERAAKESEPFDTTEWDAAEIEPHRLSENLRTASLFAARRLVLVENAQLLFERSLDMLLQYAEQPSPKTSVVFVIGESRKPKRKEEKAAKRSPSQFTARDRERLLRKFVAVECPIVPQRSLPGWCVTRSRMRGRQIEPAAARRLVELAGTNLGQLDGQIESLVALCRERPRITSKDVSDLVGGDRARRIRELTEAIAARSAAVALRALDRLLRDSDSPGWIILSLGREIRRLIILKELSEKGLSPEEISQRAGVQPWLVKKLLGAVRHTSVGQLKANLRLVLEADVDCKTGGGRDSWILERLVLKLCSRPPVASAI